MYMRTVRSVTCGTQCVVRTKPLSTTSHTCACVQSFFTPPPLLSPLSSSPVLLNVGVGSAVLEVGVGVIGAIPTEFTATTLMV